MLRCSIKCQMVRIMSHEAEPIMSPDLATMMKNTAALVDAVVLTNLRAARALLSAESPQDVLALQQRFVSEYTAVLMQGTMAIVDAVQAEDAG